MKKITTIAISILTLSQFSCTTDNIISDTTEPEMEYLSTARKTSNSSRIWNFDNLNDWSDASQNSAPNYFLDGGHLRMFTNPNTWERTKIKSASTYGTGIYTWRIFVPEMGAGDMSSIGAFLYYTDNYELDFEIGYGSQLVREELAAQEDDLVVYMTSQSSPAKIEKKTIKRNQWYTFTIEVLPTSGGKYLANWKIDGNTITSSQLNYGKKAKFRIFCSMENLQFMGDHIPQKQNYALFDFVEYSSL